MKKIIVGMVGVALVSGCSTASVNDVSYPVQREENVLNKILPIVTEAPATEPSVHKKLDAWSELSEETVSKPEPLPSPSPSSQPETSSTTRSNSVQPTQGPVDETAEEVIEKPQDLVSLTTFVDSLDLCKVPEYTFTGPHAKGFPITNNAVPYTGTVNVAVIPIDFSNAPGSVHQSLSQYEQQIKNATAWSKFYSGGKMTYNISMHSEWLRAPKEAQEYPKRNDRDRYAEMQDWISVADDYYDFSNIDFVYFLVPEKAYFELGADMYGNGRANSNEGYFEARTFTYFAAPELVWSHMVHEILHDQGFIGHGPQNGSGYGIMMGQWYHSMSVLSWPSFMAGWLDKDDIVCIDARDGFDEVNIDILSLDRLGASPGIKSVIIRTGETTATVAEYRTNGLFSSMLLEKRGVTIYNLDTSKESYRCDSCDPLTDPDAKNWWNYVASKSRSESLYNNFNWIAGQSVVTNKITFKIIQNGLINISM